MSKGSYDLVLLPGDGIGVEVIGEAKVLVDLVSKAVGVGFALDEIPCGGKLGETGTPAVERCFAITF